MEEIICFFKGHDEKDTSYYTEGLLVCGKEVKHYIPMSTCLRCGKSILWNGSKKWLGV